MTTGIPAGKCAAYPVEQTFTTECTEVVEEEMAILSSDNYKSCTPAGQQELLTRLGEATDRVVNQLRAYYNEGHSPAERQIKVAQAKQALHDTAMRVMEKDPTFVHKISLPGAVTLEARLTATLQHHTLPAGIIHTVAMQCADSPANIIHTIAMQFADSSTTPTHLSNKLYALLKPTALSRGDKVTLEQVLFQALNDCKLPK